VILRYLCSLVKNAGASQTRRSGIRIAIRAIGPILLWIGFIIPSMAQQVLKMPADLSSNPEWFPRFYKPYQTAKIPEVELRNSASLLQLIGGGKLQITLSQLKTAVRDNNLDILSSNITALYAQTDRLRAKGGGAPRGGAGVQIPSSLFAGAIGAGIGSAGGLGSFGSAGGITGGARQVFGAARGSFDPSLSLGFSIDRTDSPLNSIIVSGLPEVVSNSTAFQARFSQAFATGSSLSITFNNMRQSSTQANLRYNPDFISQLSISLTQNLLSGFGKTTGRRFLEVTKNETKIMQENVRLQINTTLAQAQSTYWDLVAARDNVRLAAKSLSVAQRLFEDTKTKEEIGTASGLDIIAAESEVAARQRDLAAVEAALQLREADLKNIISKNLAEVPNSIPIEPADALPEPKDGDIPKLSEALAAATSNRSEILQSEINLLTQDIAIRYGKDLLRPSLLLFANFGSAGLYGDRTYKGANGDPIIFPGGISQSFRQVRSWSYPEYAVGFSFSINIRNRAVEADVYRAKLERQQSETGLQRTRNAIELEVRKAVIGLVQSKAQVEAAHKAAELGYQVLAAEEAKLIEGASTPYDVIRRQRDLLSAQYSEVQARVNYAKALVELDRAKGVLEPVSKN
jgi:outer membrane protein TolC